jgi:hypothetical protein
MGTHNYGMEIRKSPGNTGDHLTRHSSVSTNELEIFFRTPRKRFYEEYSCREVLTRAFTRNLLLNNPLLNVPVSVSVRCFGVQYTEMVNILFRKNKEELEKLLGEIMGVKLGIRYGKTIQNNLLLCLPSTRRLGVEIPSDGFIILEFPLKISSIDDGIGYKLSAVLAILKEPAVIGKILAIKSPTVNNLVDCLLDLAAKRALFEDTSYKYCPISSAPNLKPQKFESRFRYEISKFLRAMCNDDGSDCISLLYLSIFLKNSYMMLSKYENGPVNAVRSAGNLSRVVTKILPNLMKLKNPLNLIPLLGLIGRGNKGVDAILLRWEKKIWLKES